MPRFSGAAFHPIPSFGHEGVLGSLIAELGPIERFR